MTKVLVTNDDGIDSPGWHALAGLAVAALLADAISRLHHDQDMVDLLAPG